MEGSWRKSTHSTSEQCVEVGEARRRLAVRDSKDPGGPQLALDAQAWHRFMSRVKQAN
jgi:hypothetical protein